MSVGLVDRVAEPETPAHDGVGHRARLLVVAAAASVLLTYALMVAAAGLAGLTAGAGLAIRSLLVAAIPLWLAAHQVPLVVDGAPLGVLPLLPTLVVLVLIAVLAYRTSERLGARLREDASVVVATLAGTHASVAVLATALPQSPVRATPWAALLGGGLVAAAGAGVGALRRTGLAEQWRTAPAWLRGGVAAAGAGASALATGGALLLFAALLVGLADLHARVGAGSPTVGAELGMTLLSLCYLPNALVAAVSWLAGPGVSIGVATASPLSTTLAPLPPIPLMAAMPAVRPPGWTAVVFVLPVLAGGLTGLRCRYVDRDPLPRLRAVAVAAVMVAAVCGVLAALVSGRLAAGPFDPVVLPALPLAGAVLVWLGLPAAAVVLLPRSASPPRRDRVGRALGPRRPGPPRRPPSGRADSPGRRGGMPGRLPTETGDGGPVRRDRGRAAAVDGAAESSVEETEETEETELRDRPDSPPAEA